MGQLKKLVLGATVAFVCCIMSLMIFEYRFFKIQAKHMLHLQNEYRVYLQTVKTVINDYTKTKERLVLLEELIKGEKKNPEPLSIAGIFNVPFPEGMRIYSSDDQELDTQDSFLVVNRELEYLKEATLLHIKEAELGALFKNVDLGELQDYTECLLQRKKKQKGQKYSKKVTSSSNIHSQQAQAVCNAHKKDMLFSWPIDRSRFWLSSFFGPRKRKNGTMGFHYGIDMAALKGTSVMAAAPGVVVEARYDTGYGNTIVLAHNGKYKTRYAHLDSMFVHVGQRVQRGALIATVGNTGYVRSAFGKDPSHLHFELYVFGKRVNPMQFLV